MSCIANSSCLLPTTGTAPQTFATAVQLLAAAQCAIVPKWPPDANVEDNQTFDFIVIGAGSAGSVVASRLSENKNWNVLLVESGGDPPVEANVPGLDTAMFNTQYDWQYYTTNDGRIHQAQNNGNVAWPRGRMLGGTNNVNAMMYFKGNPADYQSWYNAGNKDWHPDIVKKYFNKAENYQYKELLQNAAVAKEYGASGPLMIDRFNSTLRDYTLHVLKSWDQMGIKEVPDLNTAGDMGCGIAAVTSSSGIRQSSVLAYINPVQDRPNLKVLKNALCTELIIDEASKKVTGVKVEKNEKILTIRAKLEVILSAGTVNSPQLLMLSGIGPKKHLESKNITCKIDSPMVGQNLQDHMMVPVTIYGNGASEPSEAARNFDVIRYLYNRQGYLAQADITDAVAFYSASKNATRPDFQNHLIMFRKNNTINQLAFGNQFNYKPSIVDHIVELNNNHILFSFFVLLLHPYSKGNISLATNNPKDHPLIHPNYLKDPRDMDAIVTGIKKLTKIVNTDYFKSIDAFLGRMKWEACDNLELDSTEYWKCVSLNMALTVYHPVGTCTMGRNVKTSVVSSKLKVHGLTNLRVIDASVMPTETSGNTNGPSIMIGERGADLIKEDYQ